MHSFMCCYKNKVQLKADENNNRESKQTTFKDGLKQEYDSEYISVFNTLHMSKHIKVLVR